MLIKTECKNQQERKYEIKGQCMRFGGSRVWGSGRGLKCSCTYYYILKEMSEGDGSP